MHFFDYPIRHAIVISCTIRKSDVSNHTCPVHDVLYEVTDLPSKQFEYGHCGVNCYLGVTFYSYIAESLLQRIIDGFSNDYSFCCENLAVAKFLTFYFDILSQFSL